MVNKVTLKFNYKTNSGVLRKVTKLATASDISSSSANFALILLNRASPGACMYKVLCISHRYFLNAFNRARTLECMYFVHKL